MDELPGIVFLLKSCPLLETLTVKMGKGVNLNGYIYPYNSRLEGKSFWESQRISSFKCLKMNLKRIKVRNFKETENAIRFVEFLLLNSKALEKLIVVTSKQMPVDGGTLEECAIIDQRLRQFPRASPDVQVTDALAKARLEFSNLIGRIDFTKSNQWIGSLGNLGQASCLFLMLHYKNELFTGWAGWKPSLIMDSFLGNLQEAIFTMDAETTQVTDALAKARLEFSNLIDRIDFTKSNQWTGAYLTAVCWIMRFLLRTFGMQPPPSILCNAIHRLNVVKEAGA
ncbi:hypothetical protein MRB53_030743 [Persea americana]|uniref:Uncharacterized protein n=1 Tax=Persea americana TaxID=3435 RepID=A0ACC2KMN1_PERAE|nr:hypothetical protein MRB53_030743 [Persea americana]